MQVITKDKSNINKKFLSFPCAMAKIYCARTSEGTAKEKRPTSERPKHGPLPVRKSLTRVARASTRARQGAGGGGSPRAANRSIRSRRVPWTFRGRHVRARCARQYTSRMTRSPRSRIAVGDPRDATPVPSRRGRCARPQRLDAGVASHGSPTAILDRHVTHTKM